MKGFLSKLDLSRMGLDHVGRNVLISERASIYTRDICIGHDVRIDDFTIITGSVRIGSNVHIAGSCTLSGSGGIEIEDYAGISSRCGIYSATDDFSGSHLTGPTVPPEFTGIHRGPVRIGRHAVIGTGSTILPGVTIGEGVAVGAMSLVRRDLMPWMIYAGIPARIIRPRSRNMLALEQEYNRERGVLIG